MKLIIDIDEKYYKQIKDFALLYPTSLYDTIRNGTPLQTELEEIKAEIDSIRDVEVKDGNVYVNEFEIIELLDKHIKEINNEQTN